MVMTNDAEAAEHHMSKQTRGLYQKFKVERTDGKSAPGEKHHGCEYFVLDMDHDKHARAAIEGYVQSLEKSGDFPLLAADLRQKYLADALAEAVTHEREMVCQDFGMQQDAATAVHNALAAYRATKEGGA